MLKKITALAVFAGAISVGAANTYADTATRRPASGSETTAAVGVVAAIPPAVSAEAAKHSAEAAVLRAAPNAAESKRPGSPGTALHCERIAKRLGAAASPAVAAPATNPATVAAGQTSSGDILSSKDLRDLIANAKTPAEHRKLAKHFATVAARYDADATDHAAEAKAYRSAPAASETRRPGHPDTAAHCDRLAAAARDAANAARDLARDHELMAK